MKGKKKYIVPLLLAGVTASGYVAEINQQQHIQVEATETFDNLEGAELRVKPFLLGTTYAINDPVYLPEAEVVGGLDTANGEEIVYTIKQGDRKLKASDIKTQTEGEYTGKKYFVASDYGSYSIDVEVKKDKKVISAVRGLTVSVKREAVDFRLPNNSEYVIPAKLQKNTEGFKIPVPVLVTEDNKGNDVEKKLGKDLTSAQLVAYLRTPGSATTDSQKIDLTSGLDTTNYAYYAVDKNYLTETGTYEVIFEYKDGDTVLYRMPSSERPRFQVVASYDTSNIKLAMDFLDEVPSSKNVNTDISIPKVKVVDKNVSESDAVNAFVKVTVTNLDDPTYECKVNYENFTFRPTKLGRYTLTYEASIPVYGSTVKTDPITYGDVIDVADNQAPTIIHTYDYEFDAEGEITKVGSVNVEEVEGKTKREVAEELFENRRVDVPSVAYLVADAEGNKKATVTMPAVYAFDNYYKYHGKTINDGDITIKRYYRDGNGKLTEVTEAPEKAVTVSFPVKGDSEFRYVATDKDGNTLGEITCDIYVYDTLTTKMENSEGEEVTVEEHLKTGKTKIDLNVGTTVVSSKEKTLSFAKPTATDTFDTHIEVRTFYKVNGVETELTDDDLNADGEYEIDIEKIVTALGNSADTFEIYAKAYVDSTLIGTRGTDPSKDQLVDSNVVTSDINTITVVKIGENDDAPEFSMTGALAWDEQLLKDNNEKMSHASGKSIDDAGYLRDNGNQQILIPGSTTNYLAPFDQGSTIITLPEIKFTDEVDSKLTVDISIKDRNGNEVPKTNQGEKVIAKSGTKYTYTVSGVQFKLSTYGVYTVTYTATDIAGNITVKTFGIRVNVKTEPTIIVDDEDKFGQEIEVGKYFTIPKSRLVRDGENIPYQSLTWEIYKTSENAKYVEDHNGFTPTSEGTFFIRYKGTDLNGIDATLEDSTYIVVAKDTLKPVITINEKYDMPHAVEWKEKSADDKYMEIAFPIATAQDQVTNEDITVKYSVSGPSACPSPKDMAFDDESLYYKRYFKATAEGKYTITYTATDKAGNTETKTLTIEVGDCQAPDIAWANKEKDIPTEIKLNESYAFNIKEMLNMEDNKTSYEDLVDNVVVQLTGPDNTVVDAIYTEADEVYEFNFTKAGDYTLSVYVTDKVGNKTKTLTSVINVPAEETDENKVSPVLGTVLVVLSVVVLAGVVIYFVASSKKKSSKKSTKKSK